MRSTGLVVVAVLVVLAGCGGGGGSETATPGPTSNAPAAGGTTAGGGPTTEPTDPATGTPTATATPDPRPDWVRADGSVDGTALERRHYAALGAAYRVSVVREGGRNLTLYGSPDVDRLDVGAAPRAGYYDAPETSARLDRTATPAYAYEYGTAPRPNTDAVYGAVLGTYPGRYLSVATASYEGPTDEGGHRLRVTGVDGDPPAPGTAGELVDLSGTATVGPDGVVRSLSITETVRRPDGSVEERVVTVRTATVEAVPRPDWLDDVPRLRGSFEDDRRTFGVAHAGGPAVANGTTVTLRNGSAVLGTATLNDTLSAGASRSLALVVENGTERLVAVDGTVPAGARRLPADAYLVVETDAAVLRVGTLAASSRGVEAGHATGAVALGCAGRR